jgi:hypothetical protein
VTGNLQSKTLAIDDLIRSRCRELGLSSVELIRRCGYANLSKGLRRLEQLGSGEFDRAAGLIRVLPSGLEVTWERVEQAIESSKRQVREAEERLRDAEEAAWRRSFKPHAIILTESSRPEPIFVAAMIGVDTLLRIDFNNAGDLADCRAQAIDGLRSKLKRWNKSFDYQKCIGSFSLPAFGRVIGFVVNLSPDRAVRFDLEGRAIEILPKAWRVGQAALSISGKAVPAGLLQKVLGSG